MREMWWQVRVKMPAVSFSNANNGSITASIVSRRTLVRNGERNLEVVMHQFSTFTGRNLKNYLYDKTVCICNGIAWRIMLLRQ